jgi:hypothetical protein
MTAVYAEAEAQLVRRRNPSTEIFHRKSIEAGGAPAAAWLRGHFGAHR